tara:strand:+ start:8675 stop:9310 length:636 start_codon:yes stop_codon:yes gene_type:complete
MPRGDEIPQGDGGSQAIDPSAPPPRRRELDPGIRDLLREEAEHEARVRAREAGQTAATTASARPAAPLQTPSRTPPQAPSGDDNARRLAEAQARTARLGATPGAVTHRPASRADLLPDVEEINSTLRSPSQGAQPTVSAQDRARQRRNFRIGLAVPVVAALLMLFVYLNADRIRLSLPQTTPAIDSFTATLDQGRFWLDAHLQALVGLFRA